MPKKKENIIDFYDKYINVIRNVVEPNEEYKNLLNTFIEKLHKDIKPNIKISEQEAIELLAQFTIMQPIFEMQFKYYKENKITKLILEISNKLQIKLDDNDKETLLNIYKTAEEKSKAKDNNDDKTIVKQSTIKIFLNDFINKASPKLSQQLGIVFTPVEVVDFIIHSVNDILQEQFGVTLSDRNVDIIDPFTGAGTFITRLLQSKTINPNDMQYQYENNLHAYDIVPLSYHIASMNIEDSYNDINTNTNTNDNFQEFNGTSLVDTFKLYEDEHR